MMHHLLWGQVPKVEQETASAKMKVHGLPEYEAACYYEIENYLGGHSVLYDAESECVYKAKYVHDAAKKRKALMTTSTVRKDRFALKTERDMVDVQQAQMCA